MERYLEGEELDSHDVAAALKLGITRGEVFPVACGVATKNLGTHALLDLIVEGVPSPAKRGAPFDAGDAATAAFVFKTIADPFAGRINLFRVVKGTVTTESTLLDVREKAKERMGSLLQLQGKDHTPSRSSARATSVASRSSRMFRPVTSSSTARSTSPSSRSRSPSL